jgi:hypothetical protein
MTNPATREDSIMGRYLTIGFGGTIWDDGPYPESLPRSVTPSCDVVSDVVPDHVIDASPEAHNYCDPEDPAARHDYSAGSWVTADGTLL